MELASRARIGRHPIHPMLVVFPIGLFIFSFVADLFHLGTGARAWADAAYYAMAGGLLGGVAAAVPGAMDLFSLPHSRARRLGVWHMIINLIVLVLFALNFWLRSGGAGVGAGPVWLSFLGAVLLAVSGWLGGEMVYVHGVGQSHAAAQAGTGRAQAPRRH